MRKIYVFRPQKIYIENLYRVPLLLSRLSLPLPWLCCLKSLTTGICLKLEIKKKKKRSKEKSTAGIAYHAWVPSWLFTLESGRNPWCEWAGWLTRNYSLIIFEGEWKWISILFFFFFSYLKVLKVLKLS